MNKGCFTMPGEAGYEKLTLQLADRWGADVIRDSDGTKLSDEIVKAGYDIYSTICIIRNHNDWARTHQDLLQQTFLITKPVVAMEEKLEIDLLEDYFKAQFVVNDSADGLEYWEVYDRTNEEPIATTDWEYDKENSKVIIKKLNKYHSYTVSFLAYRIWEEISMYNHITNNWDSEHLMPIDPRTKEAQEYLYAWLKQWCEDNPDTNVVRFTSMFYNFVWIWGNDSDNRNLFTDWGSYDFTVSPEGLREFEKTTGIRLSAEDFVNGGKFHVTHMPPTKKQLAYMNFINEFVVEFGRKLVDLVHSYEKKAYVFYDDSWIGVEPYSELFPEFGFDGIIKCVFSGYEARLCAGVDVPIHEIRLHPYLFPVGLGGKPTFSKDGNPTLDAKKYWINVRRALLRKPVERIGLGGYIHLVEGYPDFVEYIEKIANEFRKIKTLHENGKPKTYPIKVAVLHSWGALRPWTLSGHFHESYMHDLIHINEALSGLPVDVSFINFDDIRTGKLSGIDVIINAGRMGTAWSGGEAWLDMTIIESLTRWVCNGGTFIGVGEPSAIDRGSNCFKMSNVLGVDKDTGAWVNHGKYNPKPDDELSYILGCDNAVFRPLYGLRINNKHVKVIKYVDNQPVIILNNIGKGQGIYLSSFENNCYNTRMFMKLLLYSKGLLEDVEYLPDNPYVESAVFPNENTLVLINNSDGERKTTFKIDGRQETYKLGSFETKFVSI